MPIADCQLSICDCRLSIPVWVKNGVARRDRAVTVAVKRVEIAAQAKLRSVLRDYFLNLDAAAADPGRRVAWCTSVGPCEMLTALGFEVFFPENHGAMLGARKVSQRYIPRAVGVGYAA